MTESVSAAIPFWLSRRVINAIYFLLPPLGVLFMIVSPGFSNRERMGRAALTAAFVAVFALFGPTLHGVLDQEIAKLASSSSGL